MGNNYNNKNKANNNNKGKNNNYKGKNNSYNAKNGKQGVNTKGASSAKDGKEKRKKSGTEIFLIVFAIVAVVGIVASIIIGAIISSNKNAVFNYLEEDLSKYISVSGDYKNVTIEINTDPVEDIDVEQAILKALYNNRNQDPIDGKGYTNVPITAGDVVNLYYRGYTLEEGKKIDFDGGCNFASGKTSLGIGSGQFITGFELELLGKNPADYSSLKTYDNAGKIGANDKIFIVYTKTLNDRTTTSTATATIDLSLGKDEIDAKWGTLFYSTFTGTDRYYGQSYSIYVETDNGSETIKLTPYRTTGDGQLISLTFSAFYANGDVVQSKTALIDLSDPDLDSKYGEGFREFFLNGAPVGTKLVDENNKSETITTKTSDGKNSYFDITVAKVYDIGNNPLTIEVKFPTDYGSEDLRGKTAYFDVYVDSIIIYDAKYNTPQDIDDTFITETLKLTEEDLKDYEGTLVEKYRAKLRADLVATYEESKTQTVYNELLQHYVSCTTVKKLPEGEVRTIYDQYYNDIESQYASYSAYYASLDAFARDYMKLSSNADWKAELRKIAEEAVTQKLVFYYIIRQENVVIPEDEFKIRYEEEFNEVFERYLGNVECKPDKYETTEAYEKAREEYRVTFASYYGEEYFRDNITYEYAFEKLSAKEGVVIKTPADKYK